MSRLPLVKAKVSEENRLRIQLMKPFLGWVHQERERCISVTVMSMWKRHETAECHVYRCCGASETKIFSCNMEPSTLLKVRWNYCCALVETSTKTDCAYNIMIKASIIPIGHESLIWVKEVNNRCLAMNSVSNIGRSISYLNNHQVSSSVLSLTTTMRGEEQHRS